MQKKGVNIKEALSGPPPSGRVVLSTRQIVANNLVHIQKAINRGWNQAEVADAINKELKKAGQPELMKSTLTTYVSAALKNADKPAQEKAVDKRKMSVATGDPIKFPKKVKATEVQPVESEETPQRRTALKVVNEWKKMIHSAKKAGMSRDEIASAINQEQVKIGKEPFNVETLKSYITAVGVSEEPKAKKKGPSL